jgi:invasion protein IalB
MIRRLASALALAVPFATGAAAQSLPAKPVAPANVGAEPQSTSATFGDWVLRCQRQGDGAAAPKVCEVALTVQTSQKATIAQIALGRLAKGEALHLTAQLPVDVSFPSVVKLFAGDKDAHPLELEWRRCAQIGCFADTILSDEQVQQLRARSEPERLEFVEATGRAVRIPLSFRGLAPALDALAKE